MNRVALTVFLLACFIAEAFGGQIYLRDGVTDGDTFYLADAALHDDDPVLQSWVSYSLTRSACQLQIGGDNPARASSFECELIAREHLLETWREQGAEGAAAHDAGPAGEYLNELLAVEQAGFLREYVGRFFKRKSWQLPAELRTRDFQVWLRQHLRHHKPQTRLIGSWNYASKVQKGL
jgi:hypothetical protein